MSKELTALQLIGVRSNESTQYANKIRDKQTYEQKQAHDHRSYLEGEAIGYLKSYDIMKAELARLQNLFQNNMLTIDDFIQY